MDFSIIMTVPAYINQEQHFVLKDKIMNSIDKIPRRDCSEFTLVPKTRTCTFDFAISGEKHLGAKFMSYPASAKEMMRFGNGDGIGLQL